MFGIMTSVNSTSSVRPVVTIATCVRRVARAQTYTHSV